MGAWREGCRRCVPTRGVAAASTATSAPTFLGGRWCRHEEAGLSAGLEAELSAGRGGAGGGCVAEPRPRRPRSSQQPHLARACARALVAHPAPPPQHLARARRGPAGLAGWLAGRGTSAALRSPRPRRTRKCPALNGLWRVEKKIQFAFWGTLDS
ncbi:Dynamin-3 [Manis pentadactyla]|nr:Dynamin-3 [Manis pentadactyla]